MTKTTKINGSELRNVAPGAYEVTIKGMTYRISGGGREWTINEVLASDIYVNGGTFKSLKDAASALAMRTF